MPTNTELLKCAALCAERKYMPLIEELKARVVALENKMSEPKTDLTEKQTEATDYVSNHIRYKVLAAFEAGKTSYIYDVLQVGAQCQFSLTDLLQACRRWWPRYTITLAAEEWVDGVQMSGIKIDWSS